MTGSVDRGGLNYGIKVEDNFSTNVTAFREQIQAARKDFADLKKELSSVKSSKADFKANTVEIQKQTAARREQASVEDTANARAKAAIRDIRVELTTLTKLRERDAALTKGLSSDELAALLRVRQAQKDTAITQAELTRLRQEGLVGAREIGKQEITVARQLEIARAEYTALTAATQQQQEADRQAVAILKQVNKELRDRATNTALNDQRKKAGLPTDDSIKAQKDALKAKQDQARLEAQILANQVRARKAADAAAQRAAADSARASKAAAKEAERAAAAQARANAQAAREAENADNKASHLLFTFRRLFGIFAAFQAIRFGFNLFKDAIKGAFEFNALIEDSQLGIQAILVAVGDVRDSQGQLVTGAKAFGIAQAEAARQTRLLRKDALSTTATFQTLLETFQTALAPGLSAGLSTDQIRKFTSRISQAAASIGLPQSQLAEEIRSLLQGTIQQRTTRIAVALGITNEDIKRAKEAGKLADFLFQKFQAFEIAGQSALGNFSIIVEKLKDGVAQLLGEGSINFFNDVKKALSDLLQTLVIQTKEGVVINPKAVAIVQAISDGLQRGFDFVKKIAKELTFEQGLEFAKTFGNLLEIAIKILASGALGALRAFTIIAQVVGDIVNLLEKIGGVLSNIIPGGLGSDFVANLIEALILARTLRAVLATFGISILKSVDGLTGFNLLMRNAGILTGNLVQGIKGVGSAFIAFLPLIGLLAAGFVLVNEIINNTISDWTIFGVRIGDIIGLVANGLVGAFKVVAQIINTGVNVAVFGLQESAQGLVSTYDDAALSVKKFFISATQDTKTANEQIALLNKEQDALLTARAESSRKRQKQFDDDRAKERAELDRILEETRLTTQALLSGTPREDTKDVAAFRNRVRSLVESITGATAAAKNGTDDATKSVANLSEAFANIPANIFAQSEALKEFDKIIKAATDDARKLQFDLIKNLSEIGLQEIAKEFVGILIDGEKEISETTRKIAEAERAQQQNLTGIRARQAELRAQVAVQGRVEEQQLQTQLELGQKLRGSLIDQQTAALELKQVERDLTAATNSGDVDQITALTKKKKGLEDQLAIAKTLGQQIIKQSQDSFRNSGLTLDQQTKLITAASELAALQAQEAGIEGEINDLTKARSDIESALTSVIRERIAIQAAADAARLRTENDRLEAELQVNKIRATGQIPGLPQREVEQIQIKADIVALELKKAKIQEIADANLKALGIQLQAAETEKQREAILAAIGEQYQNEILQVDAVNVELEVARAKSEELRKQAEDPINFGITKGFQDFVHTSLDRFQSTLDIMKNALNNFADTIGGTISDALLDPNKAVDIRERFRKLFDGIAREVINQLVRIAIAKAILGVGLGAASGGQVPVVSKARGGRIPSRGRASIAHYVSGVGRHLGGPPPGVDPRDKTPIWAQAGEWIIPVRQVAQYGSQAMAAIQHGLIDPSALRGLAGISGVASTQQKAGRIGYASGGEIVPQSSISAIRSVQGPDGGVKIVNVLSPDLIHEEIASNRGRRVVTNVIDSRDARRNRR